MLTHMEAFEINNTTDNYLLFSKPVLFLIQINTTFMYMFSNKLSLNTFVSRAFECAWDIERGIKVFVYDKEKDILRSFRYKINYIDFSSQFMVLLIHGVLLTLICKKVNEILLISSK